MRRLDQIARALPLRVRENRPPVLLLAPLLNEIRVNSKLYATWLVWFIGFVLLVRSTLGGPDGTRYMSYIRSLVFDHDLLLMNELQHFGQRVIVTSTGYAAQIANIGVILFWIPFYLVGLLANWLRGDVGSGLASNYAVWLDFGDWVYGLLASLVMYRWCRIRFGRAQALMATLLVCGGTSFVYYATALAPSYHTISAFLAAVYLFLWDTTRLRRSQLHWFALALLLGLLFSMAQYYAVLGVFLLFDWRLLLLSPEGERTGDPARTARVLAVVSIGLVLPMVPQLIAWWITFGNPLANPYTLESDWSGVHLPDVLFSSYHGLFFTAPILVLAVLGWLAGLRRERSLFAGALVVFLGVAYGSATRIGWWAGVSFGARYFIGLTPLFVLGFAQLASTLASIARNRQFLALTTVYLVGALLALWTYGYFLQAFTYITSFSEYHSSRQWFAGQFVVLANLSEVLEQHWLAPRSPYLLDNLALFAALSLVLTRLVGRRLLSPRWYREPYWVLALACAPPLFALFLFSTAAPGEAHKQQLAQSGFYEQNLARADFDFEQFSNEYVERARYDEATGNGAAAHTDMQRALALWEPGVRQLVSADEASHFAPLSLSFGNDLRLLGYRLDDSRSEALPDARPVSLNPCAPYLATCSLRVQLLWQATQRLPEDFDVGVLLLDQSGQVVARTVPSRGLDPFPTSWWLPNDLMSDEHEIALDNSSVPSLLRLRVEVFDASINKRLPASANSGLIAEVKLAPVTSAASTTPIAALGAQISLLSDSITHEGNDLSVVLVWRAENTMDKDYTVFVHLLDAQNNILAQADSQPLGGRYPTHAWDSGEVIYDVHRLALNPSMLARFDHLAVGMYTLGDGKRLPVSTGGDFISLPRGQP